MATKKTKTTDPIIDPIAEAAKQIQAAAAPLENYNAGELVDPGTKVYLQSDIDRLQAQIDALAVQVTGIGTVINSGSDLDDYIESGKFYVPTVSAAGSISNSPFTASRYMLIVYQLAANRCTQIIYPQSSTIAGYIRHLVNGNWSSWMQISTTTVSTSRDEKAITDNDNNKELIDNEIR